MYIESELLEKSYVDSFYLFVCDKVYSQYLIYKIAMSGCKIMTLIVMTMIKKDWR